MTSYHARWQRPEEPADDPERLAIREALAFGKALFDVRTTLGLSVAQLAMRASLVPTSGQHALCRRRNPPIGALWSGNAGRLAAAHNWAICEGSAMVCEWLAGDRRTRRWRLRSVPSRRSPFMIADRDPRSPVAQVPVLRHRGMGQPERC